MEEGVGPGVLAEEAEELSQEGAGELGAQASVFEVPDVFWLVSGGLQQKSGIVWFQHAPDLPFSVRSTEVELLARVRKYLVKGAVAQVLSEAGICCPGFPGCFPGSRPWVLNLGAVLICLSVVSSVGRAQLRLCPHDSQLVQSRLKSNLLKKFQCLYEGTAKQGNPTLLNEIYTELYITESESGEINNEHEVRQIETQSRRAETEDTPIKCNDIFRPLPGQDKPIRTVLTKGVAGIGKTVSVQKFIVDWAEGTENQEVQLIFPLPFRELNLMKDKTLSLSDLLHVFFPEAKGMEISSEEYKVLFIFDGLDECRLSLNFKSEVKLSNISESASVDELLMNLIEGNLLPSSLIWITSRPAAADLVPSECVHRVTEVRGFSDTQKEEYFRKRISKKRLAKRIITHLKSSRSLHIMCHIPVFCWISAAVLEKMLSEAERGEIPKTLTQMYTHFLIIQTNIRHEKDYEKRVKDEDMILKLGKLAFQQLVKGNLIFYEEDLRECGIDVTEASVYSGLCTQIFREELGLYQGKVFCFVHLSIQEHLAALYAHIYLTNKNIHVFEQTKQSLLSKVLNRKKYHSLSELHQRAVDEALQSKNGHLDLFLRFLLGLSLLSNQTLLRELLTQTGSCSYNKEETVQIIKQKISENRSPERSINLFHCLNELGDDSLMQEIQRYLTSGEIRETKLSSSQWSALVYVLLTSEQKMDDFNLRKFIGSQNTADEVLQKLLPVIKESRSVQLSDCGVTDEGCAALASALRSNPSHLRELNLYRNKLGDRGVKLLSYGLKDPHCKLEILWLWDCGVTDEGCADLASALRSNPSHLRELDLSLNKLGDRGVKLLSDGLKDNHCKLEILWRSRQSIGRPGRRRPLWWPRRRRPLGRPWNRNRHPLRNRHRLRNWHRHRLRNRHRHRLRNRHRHRHRLRHRKRYRHRLRHRKRYRHRLRHRKRYRHWLRNRHRLQHSSVIVLYRLSDCGVTDEGCTDLASALRSNPSHLRILDLSENKLGDSGVKLLYNLKDDPHSKLEMLRSAAAIILVFPAATASLFYERNMSEKRKSADDSSVSKRKDKVKTVPLSDNTAKDRIDQIAGDCQNQLHKTLVHQLDEMTTVSDESVLIVYVQYIHEWTTLTSCLPNVPEAVASEQPAVVPEAVPSEQPAVVPEAVPSEQPAVVPEAVPSEQPAVVPEAVPSEPETVLEPVSLDKMAAAEPVHVTPAEPVSSDKMVAAEPVHVTPAEPVSSDKMAAAEPGSSDKMAAAESVHVTSAEPVSSDKMVAAEPVHVTPAEPVSSDKMAAAEPGSSDKMAAAEPVVSVPEPVVSVPEPVVSVPEPEPVVSVPEPEPVVSVPEPEPVVSVPEPEPVVSVPVPEPVPVVSVPVPEPVVSVPVPDPVVSVPVPEPVVSVPVPEPVVSVPAPWPPEGVSPPWPPEGSSPPWPPEWSSPPWPPDGSSQPWLLARSSPPWPPEGESPPWPPEGKSPPWPPDGLTFPPWPPDELSSPMSIPSHGPDPPSLPLIPHSSTSLLDFCRVLFAVVERLVAAP
ncbi:unnamed protein product [Leuciscus chuanchicus]